MSKPPRTAALLLGVAALIAAGAVFGVQAAAATPPRVAPATRPSWYPTRLAHVGDARQLIVVTGNSRSSSHATLRTFQLGADGAWRARFPAMAARTGWNGWAVASRRVQGTGTTPQGTFRISTAFGLQPDPGTKLWYRHANSDDYWVGDQRDPQTYNLLQGSASARRTWRAGHAERLADYPLQYEYAAVIDFNRPAASTVTYSAAHHEYVTSWPANVTLGSAIFLHINGKGSTAGCVSLRRADLLPVLRWLDPRFRPRIVMAPIAEIGVA
jgi:L,D-peptidoglycan transpeptidase YkuD (ErfK/YbiS/YcfS/YnhG family)